MKNSKWFLLTLVALILSAGFCFSQETDKNKEEKEGSYYTISTYKVSFNEIDDFLKTMEKYNDAFAKNEFILSKKVMTHVWGEDWAVISILEYADFASIEKAQIRMGEIYKELIPDKEERKKATKEYQKMIKGHYDSIVKEVPSLTK